MQKKKKNVHHSHINWKDRQVDPIRNTLTLPFGEPRFFSNSEIPIHVTEKINFRSRMK